MNNTHRRKNAVLMKFLTLEGMKLNLIFLLVVFFITNLNTVNAQFQSGTFRIKGSAQGTYEKDFFSRSDKTNGTFFKSTTYPKNYQVIFSPSYFIKSYLAIGADLTYISRLNGSTHENTFLLGPSISTYSKTSVSGYIFAGISYQKGQLTLPNYRTNKGIKVANFFAGYGFLLSKNIGIETSITYTRYLNNFSGNPYGNLGLQLGVSVFLNKKRGTIDTNKIAKPVYTNTLKVFLMGNIKTNLYLYSNSIGNEKEPYTLQSSPTLTAGYFLFNRLGVGLTTYFNYNFYKVASIDIKPTLVEYSIGPYLRYSYLKQKNIILYLSSSVGWGKYDYKGLEFTNKGSVFTYSIGNTVSYFFSKRVSIDVAVVFNGKEQKTNFLYPLHTVAKDYSKTSQIGIFPGVTIYLNKK